ncbi:MAG: prepilin-type N-terminal cleavage/methylation domain-containing protein [Leptolyngbya sp. DLM2.Bin15]|nr:MAG: prepilin-type N-terminal cleavage/methylation domain-containing protein [Leptolyngbya sp. DLM2.Bin15]
MKTTWNYKLLQFLNNKKEDGGFTLIELLVVIIIIGILSAIALPAFLNQANRARQSEATTYVGSVNRAQQAYRLEAPEFAPKIDLLGLGIQTATQFYVYGSIADGSAAGAAGTANTLAQIGNNTDWTKGVRVNAAPKDTALLGYTGVTYTLQDGGGNATTTALLCIGKVPGTVPELENPTSLGVAGASVMATEATAKRPDCK